MAITQGLSAPAVAGTVIANDSSVRGTGPCSQRATAVRGRLPLGRLGCMSSPFDATDYEQRRSCHYGLQNNNLQRDQVQSGGMNPCVPETPKTQAYRCECEDQNTGTHGEATGRLRREDQKHVRQQAERKQRRDVWEVTESNQHSDHREQPGTSGECLRHRRALV